MTFPFLRRSAAIAVFCIALAGPSVAQEADTDNLLDVLRVTDTLEIMRDEGLAYADVLAEDLLPGPAGGSWDLALDRIYDLERMERIVREGFEDSYRASGLTTAPLEAFFSGDLGRELVGLEISARDAMADEAIEDTARAAYVEAREEASPDNRRLDQIDEMVTTHDLIDANVVGGMNSSVRFYQGLADGGATELSEGDILAQVWGSEPETRTDTTEWIYGFLLMAYGPISDSDMDVYLDTLNTEEGRAMNRALFAGFDEMFSEISYALGRALAQELLVEEL